MLVGYVKEIWRFPVKILNGHTVAIAILHKLGPGRRRR